MSTVAVASSVCLSETSEAGEGRREEESVGIEGCDVGLVVVVDVAAAGEAAGEEEGWAWAGRWTCHLLRWI